MAVALSRSAKKRAKLQKLGADFVFDPMDSNLVKAVTAALSPRKVDLAVDNVGGALLPQVVALLGYGGRVSVVGRSGGTVPKFNTSTLFFRRIRIGGVSVGDYPSRSACGMGTDRRSIGCHGAAATGGHHCPFRGGEDGV